MVQCVCGSTKCFSIENLGGLCPRRGRASVGLKGFIVDTKL